MTRYSCSFEELAERLRAADADSGAAEAHGLLCGTLTAGGRGEPAVFHLLASDSRKEDPSGDIVDDWSDEIEEIAGRWIECVQILREETAQLVASSS